MTSTGQHSVHTKKTTTTTTATTTTQQHRPLTTTSTMAKTPTKHKMDNYKTVEKGTKKNKNDGKQQANANGTSSPAAGGSSSNNANNTRASGTNGTDGTINAEANKDNSSAKKSTNGIDTEADKDNINANNIIKGTINTNMNGNNANTKTMDDKPHANKVALGQIVSSYSVAFQIMHTIACVIFCYSSSLINVFWNGISSVISSCDVAIHVFSHSKTNDPKMPDHSSLVNKKTMYSTLEKLDIPNTNILHYLSLKITISLPRNRDRGLHPLYIGYYQPHKKARDSSKAVTGESNWT